MQCAKECFQAALRPSSPKDGWLNDGIARQAATIVIENTLGGGLMATSSLGQGVVLSKDAYRKMGAHHRKNPEVRCRQRVTHFERTDPRRHVRFS